MAASGGVIALPMDRYLGYGWLYSAPDSVAFSGWLDQNRVVWRHIAIAFLELDKFSFPVSAAAARATAAFYFCHKSAPLFTIQFTRQNGLSLS